MTYIDPYELLGVSYKDNREEVKVSFKRLALVCHPDKGGSKEEMDVLYGAYRYVLHQIEFGEHGRTMEEEEERFKEFMDEQVRESIPSLFEIMTDEANKKFNEAWDENEEEKMPMCYPSNYEDKMEEPEVFSREVIRYKEPKSLDELVMGEVMDLKVKDVKDFTGGGGADYGLAHSKPDEINEFEEKNVMDEFERLKNERENEVFQQKTHIELLNDL